MVLFPTLNSSKNHMTYHIHMTT